MIQEQYAKLPVTVRRAIELVGIYYLFAIILVGKDIIMPLLMAFFLAIMLLPVFRFFHRKKLPEVFSILLTLLLLIIVMAALVWFFSAQISSLVNDFPVIKQNVTAHLNSISAWISSKTNYTTAKQVQIINEQSDKLMNYAGGMVSGAFGSITSVFVFVALLPIYIFLMLFYRNLLLRFVFLWFPKQSHEKVEEAVRESQTIIKSYLVGLAIQITYITVLLGGILFFIGIKHAILIGVIFAFLNLIPYIGALIGNIIGVLLTLTSSQEIWPIFAVLGTIAFVQFLDNNILMPRIVGSKVKINALATIVGVIVAGAVAGVSGMFLSLPVIAVMKIIFDRTDNMKQWGVLLGDERPAHSPLAFPILRSKSKEVQEQLEVQNKIEPTNENEEAGKKTDESNKTDNDDKKL
ncbi:AI-2E family transporter [Flavisolibacter tropicus]|uniref:Permease n=1 Tax=Flavisolibacter tropicus TaxID=1492898 RepID=A0A172TU85_9BACT|nr:AI-2E family transporter [Flavisolibacter tropicus]ANE50655.1 permease [Flavisolibacter tropicus]